MPSSCREREGRHVGAVHIRDLLDVVIMTDASAFAAAAAMVVLTSPRARRRMAGMV